METLVQLGVALSVVLEVFKRIKLPTERPKTVIAIMAIGYVLGLAIADNQLVMDNVDRIVFDIGAILGSAVLFYEVVVKNVKLVITKVKELAEKIRNFVK